MKRRGLTRMLQPIPESRLLVWRENPSVASWKCSNHENESPSASVCFSCHDLGVLIALTEGIAAVTVNVNTLSLRLL